MSSNENLGFGGGCNWGIEFALSESQKNEFVFLLNNDARLHPECLQRCINIAIEQGAAIAGAIIKTADGKQIEFAGGRFPHELFRAAERRGHPPHLEWWPVDRVMGSAMLIRRDLLEMRKSIFGYYFDPRLFLYYDELEFCTWARRSGYKIIMVRGAEVYHKGSATSGGRGNALVYYYTTRNRILLARTFLPPWLKILFHLWYPSSRIVRAIQHAAKGRIRISAAILEAMWDGYRGTEGKWRRHPIQLAQRL
jgi:GT2 family glycosyltransferase